MNIFTILFKKPPLGGFRGLFFLFVLVFLLTACSGNSKKQTETPVLTIGVMSSMDYLPLAVAGREGYFEKHNVNVKIQKFISANERDVAFQAGSVDGGVTDYTSAALMQSGGFEMKLVSKCQAPFYIVASSASNINNLSELKGKKVAVSQNTVIDFCVDMALKSVGLQASDIEKTEINKIPVRFEMLRNNKIDATGLPNPFALIAEKEGSKTLVSMNSLGYTVTGFVFSQKAIEKNPEAIKRMYAAYNDGVAYLNSHSVNDIQDILVKEMNFPETVAPKVVLPVYVNAQAVNATDKDLLEVIDWLNKKNLLKADFQINNLVEVNILK